MKAGMKRSREQHVGAGQLRSTRAEKANGSIFRQLGMKRPPSGATRIVKKKAQIVPLSPPPPVQQFADDTAESDGEGPVLVPRESKKFRATVVQDVPEGWRIKAREILANGAIPVGKGTSKRSFAVVCSSNINRSIMAQKLLEKHDMRAKSYGTGR